jgi:D-alanine--poly(phosphoribitol) ligase subunit 2
MIAMGEFVELLKEIKDGVDFENCTNLIDGKFLDSFDIIQIVMMIEEEYDVKVSAADIIPANFNSAEALYSLVQKLVDEE